jgi:hypothetical protein
MLPIWILIVLFVWLTFIWYADPDGLLRGPELRRAKARGHAVRIDDRGAARAFA